MQATIVLLFPFDLGLELDFTGKDAVEFYKEISAHKIGTLSAEGKMFSQAEFTTQVYKFGVGIIQIAFKVEDDIPNLALLSCEIAKIKVGKVGIIQYCHSLVDGLIARAEKYATHRYDQRLTAAEIFPVFVLSSRRAKTRTAS